MSTSAGPSIPADLVARLETAKQHPQLAMLTPEDVAVLVQVDVKTVRRLISSLLLPHSELGERQRRMSYDDLVTICEATRREAPPAGHLRRSEPRRKVGSRASGRPAAPVTPPPTDARRARGNVVRLGGLQVRGAD